MIDCELEDGEEWFDAMQDLPDLDTDIFFNAMTKLHSTAKLAKFTSFAINDTEDHTIGNQVITPASINFEILQLKLAWLPTE